MPCIKALILASLQFTANLLNPSPPQTPPHARFAHIDEIVRPDFKEELSSIPASSLHAALHQHIPHLYKDGMFEHDSSAVEAIHRTNAPLATKLLAAARYDLLRRQNGNLTTTPTTTPPPIQTTAAPTLNSNGDIVLTTTNAQGSTYVTTITPVGGVYSSIVLETTTLPDGSRSTYTSFAIVPAPTATSNTGPHLQGAATSVKPSSSLSLSGLFVLAVAFSALLL